MIHLLLLQMPTSTFVVTVPPAAKVLAIVAVIYPLMQGLKKIPALTPYLKGWFAIALNIVLSIFGILVAMPADQLYTTNTLLIVLTAALSAAGVHGTVSAMTTAPTQVPTNQTKE